MSPLIAILQKKQLLSAEDVARIMQGVQAADASEEDVLLAHGISVDALLAAKGEQWDMPTRSLRGATIPYDVLRRIPEESAKYYKILPLAVQDGVLEVGIVDPNNMDALDALQFISSREKMPFKIFLLLEKDYQHALRAYEGISADVARAVAGAEEEGPEGGGMTHVNIDDTEDIGNSPEGSADDQEESSEKDNLDDDLEQAVHRAAKKDGRVNIKDQAPITKVVATILRNASDSRASDIHMEPGDAQLRVRFRVDGTLHQSLVLPAKVQRAVVARVKILAGIKLDERRKPQDGRFSANIGGRRIDFRVSTFPTYFGEKVVLRLLDSDRATITLQDLGMEEEQMKLVHRAIQAPYGIVLITGPTGSGKSTTLYAMLNEVDRETKNVLSLEDPVEYNISGVSQSQVRPEIGYTFASGIRSILRQDPDVIMVGEIRDKETAQLAIQAALTGHLVFSTLHTNNAIGAVPRLVDMGVDPFLLAPTLQLIVAQRLARRICPDTGVPMPIEGGLRRMVDEQFADLPNAYRSKIPEMTEFLGLESTSTCPNGTRGRAGVFEMFEATDKIKRAVLDGMDEQTLYQIARKNGMLTLKEQAILKAAKKVIPYEEVAHIGGAIDLDKYEEELEGSVPLSQEETEDAAPDALEAWGERAGAARGSHDII
jgi:type II secretory ATPase GspE/PulE/Tfp pilus assembly ATPase PilB-like protein